MINIAINFLKNLFFSFFSIFLILMLNLILFLFLSKKFSKTIKKNIFITSFLKTDKFKYLKKYLNSKNLIKKNIIQNSLSEKNIIYDIEFPIIQINDLFFLKEKNAFIKKDYFLEVVSPNKIKINEIKDLGNFYSFDKEVLDEIIIFFYKNYFLNKFNAKFSYQDGYISILIKNTDENKILIKLFPFQILTSKIIEIIKKIQSKKDEFLKFKNFYKKKYKKIKDEEYIDFFDLTLLDKKKIIYKKIIEKDLYEIF